MFRISSCLDAFDSNHSDLLTIMIAMRYCTIDTIHFAGGNRKIGLSSSRTLPASRRKREVGESACRDDSDILMFEYCGRYD